MTTYLDRILAAHRARTRLDDRPLEGLVAEAEDLAPCRGFRQALEDCAGLAVIAEIKRRSPSRGDLHGRLDPAELAGCYQEGGATCLSVLTDGPHFGGSPEDLRAARGAVHLPVLRKDFTLSERDVCDARLMGADAVLLIVAALEESELEDMLALAGRLGLDVLVETHSEDEVERALGAGADLIGVNQRDLRTFEVDQARAVRVAASIPTGVTAVAESGVRGVADATSLAEAGYRAVLVGESLVTAGDPAAAVADLRAVVTLP